MFVATTVDTVREMHDTDDVVLLLAAARASSRVPDHGITSRQSRHPADIAERVDRFERRIRVLALCNLGATRPTDVPPKRSRRSSSSSA